ncbi:MAG: epoxyqueuosine reductase QueH [Firmicutes bacterium]|nr:epoxyqueuosine reductase QueH [Bacillota bacterium]
MSVKKNYDLIMQKMIKDHEGGRPKVLLHSCCGPCSTACIERLAEDCDVTVFYYNPNIDNEDEYKLRRDEQIRYINERYGPSGKVNYLEGRYDVENFLAFAQSMADLKEGGGRCSLCFELRLRETASEAKEKNFDLFATTLTVSPMKNAEIINEIGIKLEKEYDVRFLVSDFKKRAGFQRSIELSKEYGLYRQHYCGCSFSKAEISDET